MKKGKKGKAGEKNRKGEKKGKGNKQTNHMGMGFIPLRNKNICYSSVLLFYEEQLGCFVKKQNRILNMIY